MGQKTRITIPIAVLILAVFVVGCSFSRSEREKASKQDQPAAAGEQASSQEEDYALPEPTGKVDDTVNAILDDADREQTYDSNESEAAQSAVSGSDDISSIANSYDQDSL